MENALFSLKPIKIINKYFHFSNKITFLHITEEIIPIKIIINNYNT
jgi:hypothetical protein